jgi:hypothetical protein
MSDPMRASLASRLLADGIPPSLLIDLLDPQGMKLALAAELLASDVALAPAPPVELRDVRTA